MAQRTLFPQWRKSHETTRYPFAERASMTNGAKVIVEGTFFDAALYPIGGLERMYLSQAVITHDQVTLYFGDAQDALRVSGTFDLIDPPDILSVADAYGRPAGVLVSESRRLAFFAGWGAGTHLFTPEQTELAATVCFPQPAIGVRGFVLDDGTLLTGDVWLIGDDGVVLRREHVTVPPAVPGGESQVLEVIRVDVVGDPLFRRRLCTPAALFETPRFVKTVTFTDGNQTVVCPPNVYGDIKMTVNNDLAGDTVLRIRQTPEGNRFEAVGSVFKDVR